MGCQYLDCLDSDPNEFIRSCRFRVLRANWGQQSMNPETEVKSGKLLENLETDFKRPNLLTK